MSKLIVEVVKIDAVENHPNADRLDLLKILGFQTVAPKEQFKVGDRVVYFPIDSLLPQSIEDMLFGKDAKIKLHNHRIRAIKIRSVLSEGMVATPSSVGLDKDTRVGKDVAELLGVTKYEPPEDGVTRIGKQRKKKLSNPYFFKYTDIQNYKHFSRVFAEEDDVEVTEKIHGTNFRAGLLPYHAYSWWRRVLKVLHLAPRFKFVYGSHNVEMQYKPEHKRQTFYKEDVYMEAVKKYGLDKKLKPGEIVYGEVYGDKIQKNYTYGCGAGERKLAVIDVMINGKYLDPEGRENYCYVREIPLVPILFKGKFDLEKIRTLLDGPSALSIFQQVKEGVVIKSKREEYVNGLGRKVLKYINPVYLLDKNNTDGH